jgi:thiamine-monophosphate kinase
MVAEAVHFCLAIHLDGGSEGAEGESVGPCRQGAAALGYVLGAGFGAGWRRGWISGFAEGLRADQEEFGIALLGGDTIKVRGGCVFSITAFGTVPPGAWCIASAAGRVMRFTSAAGSGGDCRAGAAARQSGALGRASAAGKDTLVRAYRVPDRGSRLRRRWWSSHPRRWTSRTG